MTGPATLETTPEGDAADASSGLGDVGADGRALASRGTEVAVAALVLSVLWLFFLGSILGLALGLSARRRLALEAAPSGGWALKVALAAVVIGGLGTLVAVVLGVLQVLGVVDITAACHPAVTGVTCRLVIH